MANAHPVALKLVSMSFEEVKPMMEATTDKSRAKIKTMVGQMSSHFVYCYSSFFWQHFDGQHEGQTQQQHKNIQINMIITNPIIKGTTKMINYVAVPVISLTADPVSLRIFLMRTFPSTENAAFIPAIYS